VDVILEVLTRKLHCLLGGPTLEKLAKSLPDQAVLHMINLMIRKKNWMLGKEDARKWLRIRYMFNLE